MNTAIYSPSGGSVGLAFAVPAATVQTVVDQLQQDGRVSRGYLGVQIQPLTKELAEGFGLSTEKGALVAGAQDGTPAEKAGLKSGDVITAVDGEAIANARELTRMIGAMKPGAKAEITYLRDGKERTATVALAPQPGENEAKAAPSRERRRPAAAWARACARRARAKASPSPPSTPTARRPRRASRRAMSSSRSAARRCRSRPTSRPVSRPRTRRARRPSSSGSRARKAPASSPSPCRRWGSAFASPVISGRGAGRNPELTRQFSVSVGSGGLAERGPAGPFGGPPWPWVRSCVVGRGLSTLAYIRQVELHRLMNLGPLVTLIAWAHAFNALGAP